MLESLDIAVREVSSKEETYELRYEANEGEMTKAATCLICPGNTMECMIRCKRG